MTGLPLSTANLQKFLLIQSLAFQVTASRKAFVCVEYSGRNNLIQFSAEYVESPIGVPFAERLYPPVILCLGVHDDALVSFSFDHFISFLNSLLSESVDLEVVAMAHQAAFQAAQVSLF